MSKTKVNPNADQQIIPAVIEDEMQDAYLDYSMSVIVGRALPAVKDGLKPVHRRILYAMHELGLKHSGSYKKSARIVGAVLGKYHPHGDSAVYDALVRMAQDFSLRYPLVEGQGNFGSVDGDSAAQMRYTEAKMQSITQEMLDDIDQDAVEFVENFDGSMEEPSLLPAKIPNLLVNGSTGIAVGMATNIPPHNLEETCRGAMHLIDDPEASVEDLMEHVKGPDFPTGGILMNTDGLEKAYKEGRGKVTISSKIEEEEVEDDIQLVVTEIPYMVQKAKLLEDLAKLVRDGKIEGIREIRDESDRDGLRIAIELKRDAQPAIVKNKILKYSRFQETFGIILLGLVDNQPEVLSLKEILEEFLDHRQDVVRRRLKYELGNAESRLHILDGLLIALANIDDVIETIQASEDSAAAREELMEQYSLSEDQARAVLNMRLSKLSKLEAGEIEGEHEDLSARVKEIKDILGDEHKVLGIIKEELQDIIEEYGDERRTEISNHTSGEISIEDLIKDEDVVVTMSHDGYVKRIPLETYKRQRRGGVGIIGSERKDDDKLSDVYVTNTKSYFLVFTDKGQLYWLKTYKIPVSGRYSKGRPIINLIGIDKDENISTVIPCNDLESNETLFFCSKKGYVKRTELEAFSRPRRNGIRAVKLAEGDDLVRVIRTDRESDIMIGTRNGQAIRFDENDVRVMGRNARGVRGIKLRDGDRVTDLISVTEEDNVLSLTENGYGKQTPVTEYRKINRGGYGVKNLNVSNTTGQVQSIRSVKEPEDILLISRDGMIIRVNTDEISEYGRNTQGVRVMKLKEKDRLVSVAKVVKQASTEDTGEEDE